MRALRVWCCVLAALVVTPALAFAQASITGVVRDSSGAVLPGVSVEAASPVLIEKTKTAVTDGAGQYRIVDLRPGAYTVTFNLSGFTTVKREGIELTGTFVATVNADLKVGAVAETITVTGETPVVDVQSAKRETVLSGDVIEQLPGTHAYGTLLNAMPGITVDSNGLANSPTMTFFTARGGSTNEGRMTINGMVVAASFNGGGVSSLAYDANNVDEVAVGISGGLGDTDVGGPVMNLVPRTGGNSFRGQMFFNYAGSWSSGNNLDDTLRNLQTPITQGPGIIHAYDANPSYGGPIKRDKLWFWGSYRKFETAQGVEGIFANKYALDPAHWDYLKDSTIAARNYQGRDIFQGRVTAQLTPKNRVMFSHEYQSRCEGSTLTPQGDGCRQRGADWIALGSTTQSPEANTGYFKLPYYVTQATYAAPVTNKILVEAGFTRFAYYTNNGPGQVPPDGTMKLIPVTEQSAIDSHPANFTYRAVNSYFYNWANPDNWRASVSYITGSHSFKAGYQGSYAISDTLTVTNDSLLAYRFLSVQGGRPTPNRFTYRLPNWTVADRTETSSAFAQDTWTHQRLTLQAALRYDRAWSFSPAEGNGTSTVSQFNAAPITFPLTTGVSAYKDLTPRFGAAYDVFGNGKTAIKFNVGHYLAPATNDSRYTLNNPAATAKIVTSVDRNWTDTNGNFVVDCDILNPAAQSGAGKDVCAAVTGNSLNFGKTGDNVARVNPALLSGWGVRPNDWQWGIHVQQELMPRMSLDVEYNRRYFHWREANGQGTVTDNTLVGPSDYTSMTINAPIDSRLPGGGGYPITMYFMTAAAAARGSSNYITLVTDYGSERTDYWHGFDVTWNARLRNQLNLQIGTSTGKGVIDNCSTAGLIDSPDLRGCHNEDPWQTTLRGSAAYTIPKIDVLISATVRSQPGILLGITTLLNGATWNVPNTVIQGLLGRLPPGGLATGTTAVPLLDADHRIYAARRNQVDMRFAKILRYKQTRANVGIDLGNLFNSNSPTAFQSTYDYVQPNGGAWYQATSILQPRFARFSVTFNF